MAAYLLTQDREILAKSLPIDSGDSNLVHLLICYTWCQAPVLKKGSARVPRAGERVLAIANFPWRFVSTRATATRKDCFGATPKPARETHALPRDAMRRLPISFPLVLRSLFQTH